MEEFEKLVLAVESKGLQEADTALKKLEGSAEKAETAVDNLAKASTSASRAATAQAATARTSATATATSASATATATSATAAHTGSLVAEARAWLTQRAATVASTVTTTAATIRTRAATVASLAYGAASRAAAAGVGLLRSATVSLLGTLALVVAPLAGFISLVNQTRTFQDLQAQLKTATGSLANAGVAFEALQKFAATTPYALDQSTQAFVRLVNYGLTPSERALRSYGNTSSAMGKEFMDMIEAVADATTGEFERLKEFGIKASKDGERITFTFRGVKTEVANTAQAIEDYLIRLGEVNFGNAMSDRMATLGGAISNMGDAWDTMVRQFSQTSGFDTYITGAIRNLTSEFENLTAMFASGEFDARLDAFKAKWGGTVDYLQQSWQGLTEFLQGAFTGWGTMSAATATDMAEMWDHFPQAANAAFQSVVANLLTFVDKVKIYATAFVDLWKVGFNTLVALGSAAVTSVVDAFDAIVQGAKAAATLMVGAYKVEFDRLIGYAAATGKAIAGLLEGQMPDLSGAFEKVNQQASANLAKLKAEAAAVSAAVDNAVNVPARTADRFEQVVAGSAAQTDKALATARSALDAANAVNDAVQQDIAAEYAKATSAYDQRLQEAEALRQKFDQTKATAPATDQLAQFGQGAAAPDAQQTGNLAGSSGTGSGSTGSGAAMQREMEERMRFLQEGLMREGEVMATDYEVRKTALMENIALTEQEKAALVSQLMMQSIMTEEMALTDSYNRRRAMVMSMTNLTESEKTALMTRMTQAREENMKRIESVKYRERMSAATDFFGNLASIGNTFGKKGFKIAKAAAIAQATIKTYEAATGAYAALAGIPYVGPALGAAAAAAAIAAGMANIASIKNQEYSGAYAIGGMIPSGKYGIVGEAGPEFVQGPAVVTSANATAARGGGSGGPNVVVNNMGPPMDAQASRQEDGSLLLTLRPILEQQKRQIRDELNGEILRGGGDFSRNLEGAYGLKRGPGA